MKKTTVTVGISALNEESHIKLVLTSLLNQNAISYSLKKIILISDGSTDGTVELAKGINSEIIYIVDSKKRIGKPKRMNQIFKMSNSDVVIILDADLIFKENNAIEKLVKPIANNKNIQLVSGFAWPLETKTVAQKIAIAGLNIWERAKKTAVNSDMYFCGGPVRAFGKNLYKKMTFPDNSADDVYPYLYLQNTKYNFKYVSDTKLYYRLPTTIGDFIKQTRRFVKSPDIQQKNTNKEIVNKNFTIDLKIKIKSALAELFKNPIWTIAYVLTSLYIHLLEIIDKQEDKSTWEMIISTKSN